MAGYTMHQTTVAKLESGGRPTSIGEAAALARIMRVSVSDLLGDGDRDDIQLNLDALSYAISVRGTQASNYLDQFERLQAEQRSLQELYDATLAEREAQRNADG